MVEGSSFLPNARNKDNAEAVGIKIAEIVLHVGNLLFADDSMLFCTATGQTATHVKQIVDDYCMAYGQCVNFA